MGAIGIFILLLIFISSVSTLHTGSCLGLVCGNNGHCHQGPPINGSLETFWCRCEDGYGGLFCEQKCDLTCGSPDQKCVFNESQKPLCVCKDCDANGSKIISSQPNCPVGYGGEKCDRSGWCYPNNCKNGGRCIGDNHEAQCACPDGFKGIQCQLDVNECEEIKDACEPRSTCMNTHGSYLCVCPQGFLPPDCLRPGNTSTVEFKPTVCFLDVTEDEPNGRSVYCQNGGYCEKAASKCICPPGYHGQSCEFTPQNPDQCLKKPCIHGTCNSFPGGFQCLCDDGYSGSFCGEGRDNCVDHKCHPASVCINDVDSYFCDCPNGRTGQYCEKLDCSAIPGICNHGTCIDSPLSEKSFECQCDPGYQGELCETDKNECASENLCMNNGTCVNLPGSFRCDCPRGFGGKWCDVPLDMCQDVRCENEGKCVHTSDHSPVCQCKTGFIGKKCEKECPSGFGGVRCDLRISDGICSRKGATCFNGGKCLGGFCICPPDFTGNQCEVSRKQVATSGVKCLSDPCMNNATCIDVDANIGYACICQQGYEGDICEKRKDLCVENPCGNGGSCHQTHESFSCNCPSGFYGPLCEYKRKFTCNDRTCQNGGVCLRQGNTSSKCECSYGFTGAHCEEKIDLGMFNEKENLLRSVCEKRKCSERANDGNCDADCNYAACKFDGGDCSGKREPFSKCRYGNMCADLFANGECNQACNNEECLYDGMDCLPAVERCPAKIREYCASRFANGVCDIECNTVGCGYDGGDCDNRNSTNILTNIRITVQMEPSEFQLNGEGAFMEISSALRATVRIQRDEVGPLVFGWDGESEQQRVQIDMKKFDMENSRKVRSAVGGVVVYLEVQENCTPGKCLYKDGQTVVDIISARLAKKGINSFGVPISEALVATPRRSTESSSNNFVLWIGLGCILIVALAGTLTLHENRTRKRRMINAPVWIPPMENEKKNHLVNSSQHTLLDGYYDPKRQRSDFISDTLHLGQTTHHEQYDPFFAQSYGNGNGFFDVNGNGNLTLAPNADIFAQAFGSGPITVPITHETATMVDAKYDRTVLHFLADNNSGKPEALIVEEAEKCIAAGALIDVLDRDQNTPLMLAIRARRPKLALILLRAEADPSIFNQFDRHALHEAVTNQDVHLVKILLTDERIIRDIEELDKTGKSPLMVIASQEGPSQVEMAKMLVIKGAKIDYDGASRKVSSIYNGRTALHYAALVGNLEMVKFLADQNANKDKQDEDGRTPIMLAAKEGHEETVRELLYRGASIETNDALDHTARQLAQYNHHHHIIQLFDNYHPAMNFQQQDLALHHQNQNLPLRQQSVRKTARSSYKSVKKQPKLKKENSSRDSTHLTPPPSDGSTSSPSPQHFMTTTHTTPPSLHYMSPEYPHDVGTSDAFQPQCATHPNGELWYTASPMQNETMSRYAESSYHY